MKFRVASAIHLILSIAGIIVLFVAAVKNAPFAGPIGYVVIFILVPLAAAIGIWKEKVWGLVVGMIFFLPQCINYIGETSSYKFMAPISLGITSGVPGKGMFYFFNIFAIGMVVFLVSLIKAKGKTTPNKRLWRQDPQK